MRISKESLDPTSPAAKAAGIAIIGLALWELSNKLKGSQIDTKSTKSSPPPLSIPVGDSDIYVYPIHINEFNVGMVSPAEGIIGVMGELTMTAEGELESADIGERSEADLRRLALLEQALVTATDEVTSQLNGTVEG